MFKKLFAAVSIFICTAVCVLTTGSSTVSDVYGNNTDLAKESVNTDDFETFDSTAFIKIIDKLESEGEIEDTIVSFVPVENEKINFNCKYVFLSEKITVEKCKDNSVFIALEDNSYEKSGYTVHSAVSHADNLPLGSIIYINTLDKYFVVDKVVDDGKNEISIFSNEYMDDFETDVEIISYESVK